jgi:predicted GNAT family N-acyltransferase
LLLHSADECVAQPPAIKLSDHHEAILALVEAVQTAWIYNRVAMNDVQPILKVKSPAACSEQELSRFRKIVVDARAVKAKGLSDRIKRAEATAFLTLGKEIIGVGALKRQHAHYISINFANANAAATPKDFGLELGWIVVTEAHRGRKYSRQIVEGLMARAGDEPVYATSLSSNEPMHRTLLKFGFAQDGGGWPSTEHPGAKLFLFVRK